MKTGGLLQQLIVKYKYKLMLTYALFSIEVSASLLRFYFFGEAINGLMDGHYRGLLQLLLVQALFIVAGTIRHVYDTRTYTAIYTALVSKLLSSNGRIRDVSKLSAHTSLAREFTDFLEHDLVYVAEALYNIVGSLLILFFYDWAIALTCLLILLPISCISIRYAKKVNQLTLKKNDVLEEQVDVIANGNVHLVKQHFNRLRFWQLKISNQEAINFGITELLMLLVTATALLVSNAMHQPGLMAGSLVGVYSYILKFSAGLDTIPYTLQRLSTVRDIGKRLNEDYNTATAITVTHNSVPAFRQLCPPAVKASA
jgi:ABC-type multidrug transport system fused ATPase/permease subunit